jgi:hypothetical protein
MKRRIMIAVAAGTLLLGGTNTFAEEQKGCKPMHMHKAEMNHQCSDRDVATQYQSEATKLREKAESHRKLAALYRSRTPPKGKGNYEAVAKHCEKLAQHYETAAKEAEDLAAELNK